MPPEQRLLSIAQHPYLGKEQARPLLPRGRHGIAACDVIDTGNNCHVAKNASVNVARSHARSATASFAHMFKPLRSVLKLTGCIAVRVGWRQQRMQRGEVADFPRLAEAVHGRFQIPQEVIAFCHVVLPCR